MNSKVQEWKQLREEGLTYPEIALKYGVTKQAVWDALNKIHTPSKTKYSLYYEEWEKLYRSGVGTHIIAEKYNCSRGAVYDHLKKKFIIERGQLMKKRGTQKPATIVPAISTQEERN